MGGSPLLPSDNQQKKAVPVLPDYGLSLSFIAHTLYIRENIPLGVSCQVLMKERHHEELYTPQPTKQIFPCG